MSDAKPSTTTAKIWSFVRIMNVRLRFILLMVVVGLIAGKWEDIANRWDRLTRPAATAAHLDADVEFFCPMHPSVIRAQPGNCPICGMPLSQREKHDGATTLPADVLAQVQLTPQKLRMGRIGVSVVEKRLLSREIHTVGVVDYDETRRAFIAARVKGRIEKLLVNFTGQKVEEGETLALIYSPDLLVAQQELLVADKALQSAQASPSQSALSASEAVREAARRKLLLWGITEAQITEILKQNKTDTALAIHAPIRGIVTEKKVLQGQYVEEGMDLYTIADLSKVWLQAQIFESDIAGIQAGTAVEVTTTAYPNEIFAGRIAFVAYTVDPATRTVAARVEVDNPQYKLKPGMYVAAVMRLPVGQVHLIPPGSTTAQIMSPASAPGSAGGSSPAPGNANPLSLSEGEGKGEGANPLTPESSPEDSALVSAYLKISSALAADRTADAEISEFLASAQASENTLPDASSLAPSARNMQGKALRDQREAFKALSTQLIAILEQKIPTNRKLFVFHCPMAQADWLSAQQDVVNPYMGSDMLTCGNITRTLEPSSSTPADADFAQGYYCPVYPAQLFDQPAHCPIDQFPLQYARVEKVLAVPQSAVIDTGTRKVVYREVPASEGSAPGSARGYNGSGSAPGSAGGYDGSGSAPGSAGGYNGSNSAPGSAGRSSPSTGTFQMIEVKLGSPAGDYYPVLAGLAEGDRVASQGAFLVDAENRLTPGASAHYFGATGNPTSEHAPK
ncbi:MAG: efflux RND transporter periplasmic adaptor subunit [Phycisphaeraceae bacterium]|nr:efflux RND transporter periplasmic adaptor subunit [Phycisphaeraceae bacterium]